MLNTEYSIMPQITDLYILIGETLKFCQIIEHDIKMIYAGMRSGNFEDNYNELSKNTLGAVVSKLEKLDKSDGKQRLGDGDYQLLKEITDERNCIIHQVFRDFLYKQNENECFNAFQKAYDRIENFHNRLAKLYRPIEDLSIQILKEYGRIN